MYSQNRTGRGAYSRESRALDSAEDPYSRERGGRMAAIDPEPDEPLEASEGETEETESGDTEASE